MAIQKQQGASDSTTVGHDDNGHRAKAQGLADASILADYRTAAMQEQIPHELLSATDAKDAST